MPVTASQIFDFLDQHPSCSIKRYEVRSLVFGSLRRSIRRIVARLTEENQFDSVEITESLRVKLSEWLTVPIRFDASFLEAISALGDADAVERRWGRDTRTAYDVALQAAYEIQSAENPARSTLLEIIHQLRSEHREYRIYCHRNAIIQFESILPDVKSKDDLFLHSVRDYREVKPFDVLIKMGPLRSRGWGSAPDALLSAPRFDTLAQVVWTGCTDEEDFGYDPVASRVDNDVALRPTGEASQVGRRRTITWSRSVIQRGDSSDDPVAGPDSDDLRFFHELTNAAEGRSGMRRATLVQIDEQDGILYPPHSGVLTFNPTSNADEPIAYTVANEILPREMLVIWPLLGTADFGDLRAGEGYYSNIWKERLRQMYKYAPSNLLSKLREEGIELINLSSCVRQWCRPASTVIHAPQQQRHFAILVRVLGIDHEASARNSRTLTRPWWEYAWAEIGRSRGAAIQTGFQEHQFLDEELVAILKDLLPEIQHYATTQNVFQVAIPPQKPLQGVVRFYRVLSIEEGFLVPDTILKTIYDLGETDQWRV